MATCKIHYPECQASALVDCRGLGNSTKPARCVVALGNPTGRGKPSPAATPLVGQIQFPPAAIFTTKLERVREQNPTAPNKHSIPLPAPREPMSLLPIARLPRPLPDRPVQPALGRIRTSGGPGRRHEDPRRTCSACRPHPDLPCGHLEASLRAPAARASSPTVQSSGRDARFPAAPVRLQFLLTVLRWRCIYRRLLVGWLR